MNKLLAVIKSFLQQAFISHVNHENVETNAILIFSTSHLAAWKKSLEKAKVNKLSHKYILYAFLNLIQVKFVICTVPT